MEIEFRKKEHRSPNTEFKKGHKHSKEILRKISNSLKGNIPWSKGKKLSKEHKENLSKAHLGKKLSKEHKRKISIGNKGKKRTEEMKKRYSSCKKGIKLSEETKRKIGLVSKGRKKSKEERKNMSIRMKGNNFGFKKGMISYNKGKHPSIKTRKKMRLATLKYLNKHGTSLPPMIGKNEKEILDLLEGRICYKIIRQYKVLRYLIDGYIKELNLAIEVDERPKIKPKDIERQEIIENKLNCEFLRINDFD